MSTTWQHVEASPPALLVLPPAAASLDEAHAAIELWEHYSGKVLDESQRLTVEVMMAETADGLWAAATTGREMPRQNGKGDEIEVVELWGLVQRAEAILHTVHDAVLLASQAQQRMLSVLEASTDLRRLVKRRWMGTGQQMIEMHNGGVVWYRTRTGGGGRGVDYIARLVIDEAQHATEEQLAAVAPTMLASSNPQLNALGTAGLDGKSDWWWSIRKRAIGQDPGRFGYVGHTAETVTIGSEGEVDQAPVDVTDRAMWLAVNPGVASGRGQGMDFLEEQFRRLGPESFAREHLCVWDPPPAAELNSALRASWLDCTDPTSTAAGSVAFAVDVTPDRDRASITAVGRRADGKLHGELIANEAGTAWVVPWLTERVAKWSPLAVGLDPAGPAGSLLEALEKACVEVTTITTREAGQACGALYDDIIDGALRHRGDPALTAAVGAARTRKLGDSWVWARRGTADLSPLVALTVARFVFLTHSPISPGVSGDYDSDAYDAELARIEEDEARALSALNGR